MADLSNARHEVAPASGRFATFFVHDLFFGIDVLRVQEVLPTQPMTRVALAPEIIEGLINLRGQIVTAIDTRRRLGLPPRAPGAAPMNMVVRTEDGAVSLLVDGIGDVLEVDSTAYEQTPHNVQACARELIRGVFKLEDRLLLCLDVDRALDVTAPKNGGCADVQDNATSFAGTQGKPRSSAEQANHRA